MSNEPKLVLGRGDGRIARVGKALIFSSEDSPIEAFVEAARAGSHASVLDAIQELIVENDFDVPALVAIEMLDDNAMTMLFGDITLETSARTAPRLSAAGVGTWIEHRLSRKDDLVIRTANADLVPDTSLSDGVVSAGGFELTLPVVRQDPILVAQMAPPPGQSSNPGVSVAQEDDQPIALEPAPSAGDLFGPPESVPSEPINPGSNLPVSDEPSMLDLFPDQAPFETGSEPPPEQVGFDASERPAQLASDHGEHNSNRSATSAQDESPLHDLFPGSTPKVTEPDPIPPQSGPPVGQQHEDQYTEPALSGLADGRICECGWKGPPTSQRCGDCGQSMAERVVETLTRPRLARLEVPGQPPVPVESNLSIGRRPPELPGFVAVALGDTDDLVSKHHADLVIEGWELHIHDRNSTNGVVLRSDDGTEHRVDPGVPHRVEVGMMICLGATDLTVLPPREEYFGG